MLAEMRRTYIRIPYEAISNFLSFNERRGPARNNKIGLNRVVVAQLGLIIGQNASESIQESLGMPPGP